jgi:hypothetical protein
MCQRAVWLERGRVRGVGPAAEVVRAYLDALDEEEEAGGEDGPGRLLIHAVEVPEQLPGDEPFSVRVSGEARRELPEPVFVVTVRGDHGPLFAGNMHIDGNWPARLPRGPFRVECAFGPPDLGPGRYRVELKVKQNVRTNYYEPRVKAHFTVRGASIDATPGGADVPYAIIGGC